MLHVPSADDYQQVRDERGLSWRQQQVNVIRHQCVCVQCTLRVAKGSPEPMQVDAVVGVGKEARFAVVPALHDVQGNIVQVNARSARHGGNRRRQACETPSDRWMNRAWPLFREA